MDADQYEKHIQKLEAQVRSLVDSMRVISRECHALDQPVAAGVSSTSLFKVVLDHAREIADVALRGEFRN